MSDGLEDLGSVLGKLDDMIAKVYADPIDAAGSARGTGTGTKPEDRAKTVEALEEGRKKLIRAHEIRETMMAIKRAADLDICFMVDATGSMSGHIKAVKKAIRDFVNDIKASFVQRDNQLRLSFLGYRDWCDAAAGNQFSILDFSSEVATFENFVEGVVATGGGDAPEDVNGAFQKAIKLKWKHAVRVLFHIGDAPPHGKQYYSGGDDHPDGHPHDKSLDWIFGELQKQNIIYLFGKINSLTDGMIKTFKDLHILEFEVADMSNPEKFLEIVTKASKESITKSITSTFGHTGTSKALKKTDIKMGRFYLNPDCNPSAMESKWDEIKEEQVTVREVIPPEDFDDLEAELELRSVPNMFIQIAAQPFAKGEMRLAYSGKIQSDESKEFVVLKEYFKLGQRVQDQRRTIQEMRAATVAGFLARQFNSLGVSPKQFAFVDVKVVTFNLRDDSDSYSMEPVLSDKFERFTNNTDFIKEGKGYEIFPAFTHWTYIETGKQMMVVDLEGVISEDLILLSDPAVHCVDTLRFGKANLAVPGFKQFLKAHHCNAICKKIINPKWWLELK